MDETSWTFSDERTLGLWLAWRLCVERGLASTSGAKAGAIAVQVQELRDQLVGPPPGVE